jgi:thiol-disulfide isomerase/thioredoxin
MKASFCIAALLVIVLVSGCTGGPGEDILLSDGQVLSQAECSSRGIQDSVVVYHTPGCSACAKALPVLEEISREMPGKEFIFINLAEDREEMEELRMTPTYVPTVVADCRVLVGAKSREEYLSYIGG